MQCWLIARDSFRQKPALELIKLQLTLPPRYDDPNYDMFKRTIFKPICTTKITNYCASENDGSTARFADKSSDADFGPSGQYKTWNIYAKELYEFLRPQWIRADGLSGLINEILIHYQNLKSFLDEVLCQFSSDLTIADGFGTDFLTVDPNDVTGGDVDSICGNDRNDVRALKSIINVVANSNSDSIGVPSDASITGNERAETFLQLFEDTVNTWDASSDTV